MDSNANEILKTCNKIICIAKTGNFSENSKQSIIATVEKIKELVKK